MNGLFSAFISTLRTSRGPKIQCECSVLLVIAKAQFTFRSIVVGTRNRKCVRTVLSTQQQTEMRISRCKWCTRCSSRAAHPTKRGWKIKKYWSWTIFQVKVIKMTFPPYLTTKMNKWCPISRQSISCFAYYVTRWYGNLATQWKTLRLLLTEMQLENKVFLK